MFPARPRHVRSETIVDEFCRTTEAHKRPESVYDYNKEDVRRTTITKPGYDIAFIEYRNS